MALAFALFNPSTLLGLLGPVFLFAAFATAAWAYTRVHVAKAQELAINTWRQVAEAEEAKADGATKEAAEQRELKHRYQGELAAEKLKTDQTIVLAEIVQFHKDFAEREVLFHELLRALNQGRDEIALQIKTMEARLVGLMGEQTAALREITTAVIKNGNGTH